MNYCFKDIVNKSLKLKYKVNVTQVHAYIINLKNNIEQLQTANISGSFVLDVRKAVEKQKPDISIPFCELISLNHYLPYVHEMLQKYSDELMYIKLDTIFSDTIDCLVVSNFIFHSMKYKDESLQNIKLKSKETGNSYYALFT